MSDIVERLQERQASGVNCLCGNPVCDEAAEEILRLRAENEKLRKWKEEDGAAMRVFERYRELEAENEKLRAALKPFLIEHRPEHNVYGYKMVFVTPDDLRAAAAALKETNND